MKPVFYFYSAFINRKCTYFWWKNKISILCNIISWRTKTISIKNCTHDISIREKNRCWSIPRLHHSRIILIEILLLLLHSFIITPWLWDCNHNSQRKRHTIHNKEFKCVIKHSWIRTIGVNNWCDLRHLIFKIWRNHCFFSWKHSVGISLDCINLTVVNDKSVWMGTFPARVCVSRESWVYKCYSWFIALICKILKKCS